MVLGVNQQYAAAKPNYIRSFDAEISSIPNIIKFTLGEPDFDMPDLVKEAAIEAIQNNMTHYAPSNGLPAFRQEVVNYLDRHFGLKYDADKNIITTVGVTEGLAAVSKGLLNPGEKVLIPSPYFTLYAASVSIGNGVPVTIDTSDSNFRLTPKRLEEALATHDDIKFVLLTYPSNPTGVTYSAEELEALAEVIKKHDVYCVSDEIYSDLVYENFKHVSIAQFLPERTIVLNGLSKNFAMTGLRLGYMAIPEEIYNPIFIAHQTMVTCASTPAQYAGAIALRDGDSEVARMRSAYEERRNFLIPELEALGFEIAPPSGAFYLFLKIPNHQNQNDKEFALELAKEAQCGFIPGSAFGPGGEGYLRMSYAASMEDLKEGIRRLKKHLA